MVDFGIGFGVEIGFGVFFDVDFGVGVVFGVGLVVNFDAVFGVDLAAISGLFLFTVLFKLLLFLETDLSFGFAGFDLPFCVVVFVLESVLAVLSLTEVFDDVFGDGFGVAFAVVVGGFFVFGVGVVLTVFLVWALAASPINPMAEKQTAIIKTMIF